jgi:predicted amidohydrolase YtcJ
LSRHLLSRPAPDPDRRSGRDRHEPAGATGGRRYPDRPGEPRYAPFLPEQRLRLDDALDAFTAGSAYVNHDAWAGAIEVGRRADLTPLDTDLFAPGFVTCDSAPISDARVRLTVAAGAVVHESDA